MTEHMGQMHACFRGVLRSQSAQVFFLFSHSVTRHDEEEYESDTLEWQSPSLSLHATVSYAQSWPQHIFSPETPCQHPLLHGSLTRNHDFVCPRYFCINIAECSALGNSGYCSSVSYSSPVFPTFRVFFYKKEEVVRNR